MGNWKQSKFKQNTEIEKIEISVLSIRILSFSTFLYPKSVYTIYPLPPSVLSVDLHKG